ncbi:MAG: hypothetical protein IJ656_00760 [Bacilli bacterium]|nr:hypothetical protein [Bacilli bacterium]
MNKILIYPIKSMMSYGDLISNDSKKLLDDLSLILGKDYEFQYISDFKNLKEDDFVLILVQSGGSEGIFKKDIFTAFKGPYYLLTYGSSNSLAASLEILTFLKQKSKKSEVLHGNNDYIASRIKDLYSKKEVEKNVKLGVFGKPSDWLISSDVDYKKCKEIFNIELVDVNQEEIIEEIKKVNEVKDENNFNYDKKEISKALLINEGLKKVVQKYELEGFTIRCFDIIHEVKSSACLSLALFNKDDIIATCEGDIPSMLTAYLVYKLLKVHCFQANPQWIYPETNEIDLAHCTLPLDMTKNITFDTHFESGIGVGLHGELELGDVTIVKINADLNEFYCEEGVLVKNEYRKDRCRTQVKIKLDSPVTYFLKSSLGNHHQIIYGHHKKEIKEFFESYGLRKIEI